MGGIARWLSLITASQIFTREPLAKLTLLWYNGHSKKATSGWSLRLMRGGMDLRFWGADHNLDHLQVWTTWELWTLWHEKARFSDEKTRKSTQNEAKYQCFCVWEQDAAGASPVTSTKIRG